MSFRSHPPHQIRPLVFETNVNRYADGSVLVKAGFTHVLCTAFIQEKVPDWLKGKGSGWITAEYSMLPSSTHTRGKREREKISGRTHEIQRLIGRSLRACVDLNQLGERCILIDCDVIQADGGTRTASITGGYVALSLALQKLIIKKTIPETALLEQVSAVSLGIQNGEILVDLNYEEDSSCDVDMNFVMTGRGEFVEIQGTGERSTFTRMQLSQLIEIASKALYEIQNLQKSSLLQMKGSLEIQERI